jgi:RNA-binding protein
VTTQRLRVLSGKQRRFLRALAHPLKPVIQIGRSGLTDGVMMAVESALESHELIKIRVSGEVEFSVHELVPELERRTLANVAQVIGKTLIVYRAREKDSKITLPQTSPETASE